jgi:hypothetical protein
VLHERGRAAAEDLPDATDIGPDLGFRAGAGEGNRTLMTSLEDRWRGIRRELQNGLSWLESRDCP